MSASPPAAARPSEPAREAARPGGRPPSPFRHLGPIVRPYRTPIAVGAVAVVLTQAAQGYVPIAFKEAVECLEGTHPRVDWTLAWAGVFLAVVALRGVFQWLMRLLIVGVSREMERDLRDLLFARLVRQSPGWIGRHRTGDLMSRFTSDVEAVRMSVGPGLMYVANTLAILPWALFWMFHMSPALAAVNLLPLVLLAIGTRFVSPRMHAASTAQQESQGELSTQAQESFAGVRVVKSFAREETEAALFREKAGRTLAAAVRVADVTALFYPVIGMLKWVGFVLTLVVGGRMMARGELTLGGFLAFHMYAGMLLWPMISLGWVLAMWERSKVSMARIAEILDAPREVDEPADPVELPSLRGDLEFRGLTFRYPGAAAPALEDVSFTVPAGRTVAVVGATGSGKSTLLATVPRLLDPPPGTVLLDGVPVERLRVGALRGHLGFVPQDTFLFSETVGENISLGLPPGEEPPAKPGDDARIVRAADRSRVLPEVERLPQRFDTLLGERGVNLSGGQRQRTAIARALVRDPKVLLLDDCLSAVDAKTEAEILANLREVLRGRTTLLVTHRVAAARLADEVVVLADGRVVERGAPAALLAADGPFARLAQRQSLEEALEAA